MTASISTFTLADGKRMPWLAWGNGTGDAKKTVPKTLPIVLDAFGEGAHIDTAQNYATSEQTTGEVLADVKPERSSYWLTTKLSNPPGIEGEPGATPIQVADLRASVEGSLKRLGTKPDLLLIHNPFVVPEGQLEPFWRELEALSAPGEILEGTALGVSNFRPSDLEALLSFAKIRPQVNQIEYHPWTAVHSEPILALHAKHGILTQSYGPLVPVLKAKTGGALKPVLDRIAERLNVDPATVLLLWVRAKGAVAVSSSGNEGRIRQLAQTARMATDTLTADDVRDIDEAGRKTHYRFYSPHLETDFPAPDLPEDI